jgi:hypothetical protein
MSGEAKLSYIRLDAGEVITSALVLAATEASVCGIMN